MKYRRDALLALHFKQKGLEILGVSKKCRSLKVRDRRFRSAFGTSSMVIAILWQVSKDSVNWRYADARDVHILWAFHFMKCYSTETVHVATLQGAGDEKTFRKWVWIFLKEISYHQEEVVSEKKTYLFLVTFFLPHLSFDVIFFCLF